jgi:hypothetical protein
MSFDDAGFARHRVLSFDRLGLQPPDRAAGAERLARERARHFLERMAPGLDHEEIEGELRAQWLLAYQSDATGGAGYRRVEVEVGRPGALARTAAGYYP